MRKVKVMIWGLGAMGSGMARMLLTKEGVEIVGAFDRNPACAGREMHEYLGVERGGRTSLIIGDDPQKQITKKACDVLLLATDSFVKKAFDKIKFCLNRRINVISIAEELAYPKAQNPEIAEQLDAIAKANGVSLLGTGINPGFVLDYLILALTGTCQNVESIFAKRVNDLSPFGRTVMQEQGVGISQEEFNSRMAEGTLAGHVGFPESINMIADGMGVRLGKVEQTKEPIISNTHRETETAAVEPGNLAGVRQRGFGYSNGRLFIEMDHPQQIKPQTENTSTGDYIEIKGYPDISLQINPEIPGGIGTIAMAVNMIPHVINSEPGLKTMLDLPVPRAIMGDFRDFIKKPL